MSTIMFGPDSQAHWSVFKGIAEAQYVVTLTYKESVVGFPDKAMVLDADDDEIVVCEYTDDEGPISNSLFHIGYDEINTIRID